MRYTVNTSPKDCMFDEYLFPALGNGLLQPKVEQKNILDHTYIITLRSEN